MAYLFFFIVSLFLAIILLKRNSSLLVFIIIFPLFMILNLVVHNYSMSVGKEGYSVFTKNVLLDEIIYYGEAKDLFTARENGELLTLLSKNSIFYNHFYGAILFIVFVVFNNSGILMARAVTALFFALFFVQINRFVQIGTNKTKVYPLIFLFLLYPTLTIRGLQIEQEMFVNFLMLSIINQIILSKTKLSYLISLFLIKVLAFIPMILSFINNKIRIRFYLQLLIVPVITITAIKFFSDDFYSYVVAVKSYVVMDGRLNVFPVNYDGILGIIMTILSSTYYFLFAPLDITTITNGSTTFRILLLEPLILILAIVYLIKNKQVLKAVNRLYIIFSFLFYYMLTYIMVESHVTSFMRRRVIVYVIFLLLALVIFRIKHKLVYRDKLSAHKDSYPL